MRQTQRNRGFILLLVIALIPLMGMVLAIISVNSKTLAFETRRNALHIHAQQACESGQNWVSLNKEALATLAPQKPIDLPITHKRLTISCRVELIGENSTERLIEITGTAEDTRLESHVSRQLTIPF